MSAGEAVALMQGILDSRQSPKMERRSNARDSSSTEAHQAGHLHQRDVSHQPPGSVVTSSHRVMSPGFTPDNSCCFCLTLRSGTSIIAGLNCVFYIGAIIWYLSTSSLDIGGIRDGDIISSLDISVFSICVVMVLVSILLGAAAIRQVPCQTLPWLCANTVALIMAMILIVFTILFGTTKFKLSYSEYVTILSLMGFLAGVTLFSWMVVFTFRKNLLMVAKYSLAPSHNPTDPGQGSSSQDPKCTPSAPPPAYSEIDTSSWKPVTNQRPSSGTSTNQRPVSCLEDEPGPPGYDVVMRQQSDVSEEQGPVVQRKKSLTNHNV